MNILNSKLFAPITSQRANAFPSKTEMIVLNILEKLGKSHAPRISRESNGILSVSSIYTLLKRLETKGFVKRDESLIEFDGLEVRRVFYQLTDISVFFLKEANHAPKKPQASGLVPLVSTR